MTVGRTEYSILIFNLLLNQKNNKNRNGYHTRQMGKKTE